MFERVRNIDVYLGLRVEGSVVRGRGLVTLVVVKVKRKTYFGIRLEKGCG